MCAVARLITEELKLVGSPPLSQQLLRMSTVV